MGFLSLDMLPGGAFFKQENMLESSRDVNLPGKACPVNFEFQNYTIITSKCKGPNYPHDICCGALKEFACPFTEYLNDLTNDCANTMFSYINLAGKYPPGLFANECKEGKQGLECPAPSPSKVADDKSSQTVFCPSPSPVLILTGAFLGFLLQFL